MTESGEVTLAREVGCHAWAGRRSRPRPDAS